MAPLSSTFAAAERPQYIIVESQVPGYWQQLYFSLFQHCVLLLSAGHHDAHDGTLLHAQEVDSRMTQLAASPLRHRVPEGTTSFATDLACPPGAYPPSAVEAGSQLAASSFGFPDLLGQGSVADDAVRTSAGSAPYAACLAKNSCTRKVSATPFLSGPRFGFQHLDTSADDLPEPVRNDGCLHPPKRSCSFPRRRPKRVSPGHNLDMAHAEPSLTVAQLVPEDSPDSASQVAAACVSEQLLPLREVRRGCVCCMRSFTDTCPPSKRFASLHDDCLAGFSDVDLRDFAIFVSGPGRTYTTQFDVIAAASDEDADYDDVDDFGFHAGGCAGGDVTSGEDDGNTVWSDLDLDAFPHDLEGCDACASDQGPFHKTGTAELLCSDCHLEFSRGPEEDDGDDDGNGPVGGALNH